MRKLIIRDKDNEDDGIVILRQTEPGMCGGTDATQDTRAPKVIDSDEMTLFCATSSLGGMVYMPTGGEQPVQAPEYVSAFAAHADVGCLIYLSYGSRRYGDGLKSEWALVREDIFPKLVSLVREYDMARQNGFHSRTHGLPQDFGGSVDIRYASGERISFSNNQCPILTPPQAVAVVNVFSDALKGERVLMPDIADLCAIRFEEKRDDGGFTTANMTLNADGTALNAKKMKYEDPRVFESEKTLDADTVSAIKKTIVNAGMLAWAGLPKSDYHFISEKTMTFVFGNGREITVSDDTIRPAQLQGGFFNIELEITTKG